MRPRLRTTIPGLTVALVAGLGILVLAIAWLDSRAAVLETAHEVTDAVGSDIQARIEAHLEAPHQALRLTAGLLQDRALDLSDHDSVEAYFRDFLSIHEGVSALRMAKADGSGLEVVRRADGAVERVPTPLRETDEGAPESEWWSYWVERAPSDRGGAEPHWGPVTVRSDLRAPAVTGSLPVRDGNGTLEAVVAVELSLIDLSHYLATLRIGKTGHAFVTTADGVLIAVPDTSTLGQAGEDAAAFLLQEAAFAGHPAVRAFHELPEVTEAYAQSSYARLRFRAGGAYQLASLSPLAASFGQPWFVGVIVPEDDYLGRLKRMLRIGVLALVLAIGLGLLVGNALSRSLASSLNDVVVETEALGRLEFSSSEEKDSRFQEVHDVLTAFEAMKSGLRSFARYVPTQVVRRLVERGVDARVGGDIREVTVMFSDIANFTTIAEGMEPGVLAERLSEYFSILTSEVQGPGSGGVVDKYVGDALMAFWGAPEPVPDHAARACSAALACAEALAAASADAREDVAFPTRIGLHTDRVLVGNIGSADRLGYTAIGDGVNLASRIEGLNKEFGTTILVSGQTRNAAGDGFVFRRLGVASVKGRDAIVDIHELMGRVGAVSPERLEVAQRYEKALERFDAGRLRDAAALLADQAPGDPPSARLLALCDGA